MLYRVYLHLAGFLCFIVCLSELQKYYSKDIHNIFWILNTWNFSCIMLMSPAFLWCLILLCFTAFKQIFKTYSLYSPLCCFELLVLPASGFWRWELHHILYTQSVSQLSVILSRLMMLPLSLILVFNSSFTNFTNLSCHRGLSKWSEIGLQVTKKNLLTFSV